MNESHFIVNKEINTFILDDDCNLFYDIFYKNNNIYIILPIYNVPTDSSSIKIKVDNDELKTPITYKCASGNESILIYIYNYVSNVYEINVTIEFNNIIKIFKLNHIKVNEFPVNELSLTTLCKDDYTIFPLFYEYYKNQGVSHFYIYYNGIITPEIQKVFELDNVTLIEWKFKYWNDRTKNKYSHHAQTGQINHALYRYGKDISNYMLFCDLDEYCYIPNFSIKQYILDNKHINMVGFSNYWSNTIDNTYPEKFPNKFLTVKEGIPYPSRSKTLYKTNSINIVRIHTINNTLYCKNKDKNLKFMMFHFYNWTRKDRKIKEVDNLFEML
jgi:hypothetical protein